jgi:S1-C subfamily serine protease
MRCCLRYILLCLYLIISLSSFQGVYAQQTIPDIERLERATVYVIQARNVGNDLFITCVNSGTIVSRDGLVLTNAHNTLVSERCPGDTLVIAMTVQLGEPPVPKFRAEIAQADAGLDIALIRITRELDGRLVEPDSIALPFVELADSSTIQLDDTITVIGYPGIGDNPVATVRGTINGFVTEPSRVSPYSWIKTSAVIPGLMSGGGAYDQEGRLVGIPTTSPIAGTSADATCLPVQDTNGDGLVNNNDSCIVVGGFINVLRPSNFALPLLRAATLRLSVELTAAPNTQTQANGTPSFTRLFFSPSVNEAGMPTTIIRSLPPGSNSLYLFFDYENMTPETVYELRVTINGQPSPDFSLSSVRWSGGENGLWYIGSNDRPWPNGTYEFILLVNGSASGSVARLLVGGSPETAPTFTDIAFGLLDLRNNPLGNGFVLPTGNIASARFIFRNMQPGMEWTTIWYLNGTEIVNSRQTNTWSDAADGATTTSVRSDAGLPPGRYRLELYITEQQGTTPRLAATSDFTIAGAQQGAFPQVFSNAHFTVADSVAMALTALPVSNVSDSVSALYALFNWQQVARGTLWTVRWSVDDDIFYERTIPWGSAESGENFLMQLSSPGGIPDGTYQIDLFLDNVQLATTQAQVGIGQLPIDRFAQVQGVQMRGQILDAATSAGIPGVTVILISKDFSVDEFTAAWDQSQVYAIAVTDNNGNFEFEELLELTSEENPVAYSAIITAEGYVPVSADGLEVDEETDNPLNTIIYLTRD